MDISMYRKATFKCLLVFFFVPSFATKYANIRNKTINIITGNVGERIKMKCGGPSDKNFEPGRKISWQYLYKDYYIQVAECDGRWENFVNDHYLMSNADDCGHGIAYMSATNPGEFSYKCEEIDRHFVTEMYFMISIVSNSSVTPCLVKDPCSNRFIARLELEIIDSISEYYCINENHSLPCISDDTTFNNQIEILPIVNQVSEGEDAIFKCSFNDVIRRGEEYEWKLSRQIVSRIPNTTTSTLTPAFKLLDVKVEDNGVVLTCFVRANGTLYYTEALLEILSRPTSTDVSVGTLQNYESNRTESLTTKSQTPKIPPSLSLPVSEMVVALVISFIFAVSIFIFVLWKSKTRHMICLQSPVGDFNMHPSSTGSIAFSTCIGSSSLEANITSDNSSNPHIPCIPSIEPLPLAFLPATTSCVCALIHEIPETSFQSLEHLHDFEVHTLTKTTGTLPSLSNLIEPTDDGQCSLPDRSPAAQSIPRSSITPNALISDQCIKPKTDLDYYTLPTDDGNNGGALSVKGVPDEQSSKGTQSISLTRKGSATNQPLPPIPNSPGIQDINKLSTSSELPEAVTKPMVHGYATIQDEGWRQNKSSAPDFGLYSLSVLNVKPGCVSGYTENLAKSLTDEESKIPNRDSVITPECNTYSVPYADNKLDKVDMSIYHTIDQDKNYSKERPSTKGQFHRDGSASHCPQRFSRHIYEMPGDDTATEVNCQSTSADSSFYFTLELDEHVKLQDMVVQKTIADDPATWHSEHWK